MTRTLISATLAAMLLSTSAFAQAAPPAAPDAPAAAPAAGAAAPAMDKKAKSKDCYAQATTQGLHGKARKHFHSKCMAGKM